MKGTVRIRTKPRKKEEVTSLEGALNSFNPIVGDASRLRDYTSHEGLSRVLYHHRRYLKHLSDDEIHLRIGSLISNVVYVSERNRYSINNLYLNYWRTKLAYAAEELAIRNCTSAIVSDVLRL